MTVAPRPRKLVLILRCATLFGFYGPLIGAAVLFGIIAPLEFGKGDVLDSLSAVPMALLYSIWIVPIAMILGVMPGAFTGLAYWWINSRTFIARMPLPVRAAIMAIVGGFACVLFGLCLGAAAPEMLSREILVMFVAPGMVAAVICTLMAERRTRTSSSS